MSKKEFKRVDFLLVKSLKSLIWPVIVKKRIQKVAQITVQIAHIGDSDRNGGN